MPNSRVHLIADYLRRNPCPDRHVVGFDDIAKNIEALEEGLVEHLVSSIIGENVPLQRDNYMHMDILHKLNAKHYDFIG